MFYNIRHFFVILTGIYLIYFILPIPTINDTEIHMDICTDMIFDIDEYNIQSFEWEGGICVIVRKNEEVIFRTSFASKLINSEDDARVLIEDVERLLAIESAKK